MDNPLDPTLTIYIKLTRTFSHMERQRNRSIQNKATQAYDAKK